MNRSRLITLLTIVSWLSTAGAFLLISVLIVPEESRSPWFWQRLAWVEFLIALVWGMSWLMLAGGRQRSWYGIVPSIKMIVFAYAFLSILLLATRAFAPIGSTIDRWHLALQIALGALCGVLIMMLALVPGFAAASDSERRCVNMDDTCALLEQQERRLRQSENVASQALRHSLKNLKDRIRSALPVNFTESSMNDAQALREGVQKVCAKLGSATADSQCDVSGIHSQLEEMNSLVAKISRNQIVNSSLEA